MFMMRIVLIEKPEMEEQLSISPPKQCWQAIVADDFGRKPTELTRLH